MLAPWFEHLQKDPDVITLGRTFGARFGLGVDGLTAVIDTNMVIRDLYWLAKRPGCAVVHAAVAGLANSGVLLPICPRRLEEEVARHLVDVAASAGRREIEVEAIWRDYRVHLRFVDSVPADTPAIRYVKSRHSNDVDFVGVQEGFGIDVILTHDNDLKRSPAPTADDPRAVLIALRKYEKEKRYTFALVVGGCTFAFSGEISVIMLVKALRYLWQGFMRLPWWAQAGIVAVAAYGVSRLKKEHLAQMMSSLRPMLATLASEALGLALQAHGAEARAAEAIASAREKVPARRGRRALMPTVRRVLVEQSEGVTQADLAVAIVALGYKSTARDLPAYLGRILRRERGAICKYGRWRWITVNPVEA